MPELKAITKQILFLRYRLPSGVINPAHSPFSGFQGSVSGAPPRETCLQSATGSVHIITGVINEAFSKTDKCPALEYVS